MEYNQEVIDTIRGLLPLRMRKKIHQEINKGKSGSSIIPYSTVCNVLETYREGGLPRYRKRRLKVYDKAIELLNKKGITIIN